MRTEYTRLVERLGGYRIYLLQYKACVIKGEQISGSLQNKLQKLRPDRNKVWSTISTVSMENTASATGTLQLQ